MGNAQALIVQEKPEQHDKEKFKWRRGRLTKFPLQNMSYTQIRKLDLSQNEISSLPDKLDQFKDLRKMTLSSNCLMDIDDSISSLKSLTLLDLSNNKLETISLSIFSLQNLQTLNLSNNFITTIPNQIVALTSLHTLHLSHNIIEELPDFICELPLTTLSLDNTPTLNPAIALLVESGNDCCSAILSFLTFRFKTPLDARFQQHRDPSTGRAFFSDSVSETTSWIDPRYYIFISSLPYDEKFKFSFTNEPKFDRFQKRRIPPTHSCANRLCDTAPTPGCIVDSCENCCTHNACPVHHHVYNRTVVVETLFPPSVPLPTAPSKYALPFNIRARQLWIKLRNMHPEEAPNWVDKPRVKVSLRRTHTIQDSFRDIMRATPERLRLRMNVQYRGEDGLDYGGLTREWFTLLSKEFTNPDYLLFKPLPHNPAIFAINPHSGVNPNHLEYFRFVGRLLAKALFDRFLINATFSPVVYRTLKGQAPTLDDLALVDPDCYQSLKSILAITDEDEIADLYLTLSTDEERFGELVTVDFVEGGRDIEVDLFNKAMYVRLKAESVLVGGIREQLANLQYGFNELIPSELLQGFSPDEIEELLCGKREIDVEDWKAHSRYVTYTADSDVVKWFWEILEEMNNDQRTEVFQFITGTSKVPQGGFANLVGSTGPRIFSIHRIDKSTDHLPSAHTCFNQLDLPEYQSKADLHKKLAVALGMGLTGFGEK